MSPVIFRKLIENQENKLARFEFISASISIFNLVFPIYRSRDILQNVQGLHFSSIPLFACM
jgi:hypothetical protein